MNDFLETYDNETLLEWASEHNASRLAAVRQARAELPAEMAEDMDKILKTWPAPDVDELDYMEMEKCNDCGTMVPSCFDTCQTCDNKQRIADEEEAMHPEWRCPPRE